MPAAPACDPLYRGYCFPPEIISHAVWLYYRFHLSHRDIEDLLAERGVLVSHEAVRLWCRSVLTPPGRECGAPLPLPPAARQSKANWHRRAGCDTRVA